MATQNPQLNLEKITWFSVEKTDNPKLGGRPTSDGRLSLFLDYYFGTVLIDGKRKKSKHRETLKMYLWQMPRNTQERQHNKEVLQIAKKIRYDKNLSLLNNEFGYGILTLKDADFLAYFQDYIDNYTKADIRMVRIALQRFKDFLSSTPEYRMFANGIKPNKLNHDMILQFVEYLKLRGRGEGPRTIYSRFKKVVKCACDHNVILKNPCTGISIKIDSNVLTKEILSPEEMIKLTTTHCPRGNEEVRRAFILSMYCGLRYCDVKDLTYNNVDVSNKMLRFEQNKTKGHSNSSGVVIPLNDDLLQFIGQPPKDRNTPLFKLPSYWMCLKSLDRWVKRAGINKKITWHCARHSFAVNVLNGGANIKTVSSLLGHSSLKYTEKYTRAVDSLKQAAIDSLPTLNLT